MTVDTLVTMPDLSFPEPPAIEPPRGAEYIAAQAGRYTSADFAAIAAERDRAVAEAKRLRAERDATGLHRVVGAIAEGIGAAVALMLALGLLVACVLAVGALVGWRPWL